MKNKLEKVMIIILIILIIIIAFFTTKKNIKATNLSSIAKQLKSTTEKEIDGAENSL